MASFLSAVDSHTAEKLVKGCLCGPIMKNRTIIIATHHVERLLDHSAWIVQLEAGRVVSQGTPEELGRKLLVAAHELVSAEDNIANGVSGSEGDAETTNVSDEATLKSAGSALVEKELMAKCASTPSATITSCLLF